MQYKLFCYIINLQLFQNWGVTVKIKNGYELQKLSEQWIITYNGNPTEAQLSSIILSDTAVFLWNLLKEKEVTKTEMLDALIGEFDISTVLALGNIDVFVRTLKENDIIEE